MPSIDLSIAAASDDARLCRLSCPAGGVVTADEIHHSVTNQNYEHRPQGAGDLNGDGYSDVVVPGAVDIRLLFGAAAGVGHGGVTILTPPRSGDGSVGSTNTGANIGVVGDVDGDGMDDVVVGAPYADRPGYSSTDDAGALYFYPGNSGLFEIASTPTQIVYGAYGGAHLGRVVSRAHDVNGDGYADVVAQEWTTSSAYAPARVFAGSSSDIGAEIFSISNHFTDDPLVGVGDIASDGYDDLARRDRPDTVTYPDGAVSVYRGGPSIKSVPAFTIGAPANGRVGSGDFGRSIVGPGDVDGDGRPELAVAAPHANGHGEFRVYEGSTPVPSTTPTWTLSGDQAGELFGTAISGIGDVDGDGYADADGRDDLLVGAPGYSSGTGTPYGRVSLYKGTSTGLSASVLWLRDGTHHPNEQFGRCLVGLGDLLALHPRHVAHRVADHVHDAELDLGLRVDRLDGLGETLQTLDRGDQDVLDGAILQLRFSPLQGVLVFTPETAPTPFSTTVGTLPTDVGHRVRMSGCANLGVASGPNYAVALQALLCLHLSVECGRACPGCGTVSGSPDTRTLRVRFGRTRNPLYRRDLSKYPFRAWTVQGRKIRTQRVSSSAIRHRRRCWPNASRP